MTTATVEPPSTANEPAGAQRRSDGGRPARRSRRRGLVIRFILCAICGLAATVGVNLASAKYLPWVPPNPAHTHLASGSIIISGAYPTIRTGETFLQRLQFAMANHEDSEVAVYGNHLEPWHLRLSSPFASRLTWFEKGRVFGSTRTNAPPTASSAAVSCWSFANSCWAAAGSHTTGPLPAPPELTETNQQRATWATAIEQRGWPFRAFSCRISAPMQDLRGTGEVYVVEDGYWSTPDAGAAVGGGGAGSTEAIQAVRVVPTRPIWSGLFANTLFFGVIFYGIAFLPGMARRWLRHFRNACPDCGYSLSGQPAPGCPECGWNRQHAPLAPAAAPIPQAIPADPIRETA